MRPKRQIFAGWALGLATVVAGSITLPAAADKASNQRAEVVLTNAAMDFRRVAEPTSDSATVRRLAELYGPDAMVETPLQRVHFDLGDVDRDTRSLRLQSDAEMREALCLAEAVYYEARSESRSGQVAVAQVIRNRVASKHFPDSICGVVYQGSERRTGCQFSFTCDGSMDRVPTGESWTESQDVARFVLTQSPRSLVGRSTHYHTTQVSPVWSATLEQTRQVGSHIFYRFPWRERPTATASLRAAPPS
ncbi:cell wall hydrolase [Algimonas porphyrae]|uniref:Cell wall hydrolase SleB domain-containing protein n=1 Tax=Algimonas porphyrae TaxID=1128113 RepID=A0ABQ5V0H6_9PROT|nr:cell wall hydrolase [Algimonas porphyrae]GLQ20174.1 hypothetical protein GCM10007854_11290 [Algimonas porphyrae]